LQKGKLPDREPRVNANRLILLQDVMATKVTRNDEDREVIASGASGPQAFY